MASSSRMLALLGLLAIAGYQNRDKLGTILGNITGQQPDGTRPSSMGRESTSGADILSGLGGLFGGGGQGISGAIGDLFDRFTGSGRGEVARSWVERGENREPTAIDIEEALGPDSIDELTRQTGLSREELLNRLRSVLPVAVDKFTPEGRLPTEAETSQWASRVAA
jgi:uncharacterized protein YidB (DUF937 family)